MSTFERLTKLVQDNEKYGPYNPFAESEFRIVVKSLCAEIDALKAELETIKQERLK